MRSSLAFGAALLVVARAASAAPPAPTSAAPAPTSAARPAPPAPPAATATAAATTATAAAPTPSVAAVSFEDAIQRAMSRNPNEAVARADVRRAQALVEQARSSWLPTLSANAAYTRLDADRVSGGRVLTPESALNANVLLTVPLIAPRAWTTTDRAKESRGIAELTLADTRRQVALLAGRAYLTVIAQRRVLETSAQARDTARAHEDFSKSRLAGGVGSRLDAVRAAQERASSESRVQSQTLALSRAQEALGVLLGESRPIDAIDARLPTPPTLAAALGEAESRSDVVASKQRVEYARKSARDTYVEYLPILTGTAQPFFQTPATATFPTTGWQAQLLLTLPLFDGGNRYGLRHERDALYEQATSRLEAAARQARSEVRIAFEAVQRADEALARAREAASLAKEALDLSQLAYRAGATSNIEVVDAERRSSDAATEAAVAEDASRQARLDLLAAAGRFP